LLGYVLFSEIPDIYTWVGGSMIFVSAVYIAIRAVKS
jgi:drug/metabolite transporter (DMT)-like permease